MTQPKLLGLGALLVVIGAIVVALAIGGGAPDERRVPPIGDAMPAERVEPTRAVYVAPVAGGLLIAAGVALIGIGLNRWTGGRPGRGAARS